MASSPENTNMALFCDFENVALGVRDANYDKFDIGRVLERLLLKGSIVVKKAYCDWDRYKSFKATMHEANFELIEIPHVRQSGKNSADIRLVVDALDLCYTKSHVDTFVIISGDSDFSPLVSKLRENAKQVIGVGVKQSTSDLLIANCDEFIFYDDLVSESRRNARRDAREATPAPKRSPEEEKRRRDEAEARRGEAIRIAVETFDALLAERGDGGKIWASMLKQAIKRRKPDFNENYYGFRAFGNLLDEAQERGLFEVGRDEKSGAYVYRGKTLDHAASEEPRSIEAAALDAPASAPEAAASGGRRSNGNGGGGRGAGKEGERTAKGATRGRQAEAGGARRASAEVQANATPAPHDAAATLADVAERAADAETPAVGQEPAVGADSAAAQPAVAPVSAQTDAEPDSAPADAAVPAAKPAPRRRSPRAKPAPAAADEAASATAEAGSAPAEAQPAAADADAPAKPAPRRRTRKPAAES